ncbi:glycogen phosphorylase [Holotrichia oblita]|nr:glycogen phosphorylase [Holotrichia oblita]
MDELFNIRWNSKRPDVPRSAVKKPIKTLHYLTIEFLPGRTLKNTLFNLGWHDIFAQALKQKGIDINKIFDVEADAGLGNGGMGRLAACFMDSLATLNYPATAHCIKYDYGLFQQRIIDGQQAEFLDEWQNTGGAWLTARPDEAVTVRFHGNVGSYKGPDGNLKFNYEGCQEVEAFPFDMMLSGYDSHIVSNLKLWSAKSKSSAKRVNYGEYSNRVNEAKEIEDISSVLYPSIEQASGRTLRFKQQYFLVSASMQNVINVHLHKGRDINDLSSFVAIHINDTHPTMCVPELMRILMDEHSFSWDDAWNTITKCVSYTNHTVMAEALEVWDADLVMRVVPRIYQIISEIDRRFREYLTKLKKEPKIIEHMAIISNNSVRMANLAIHASHKINGVSKVHSQILKERLFKHFAEIYPDRFINVTNGITHRRWLAECNPRLTEFITKLIGGDLCKDAQAMEELCRFLDDTNSIKKINEIKLENKKDFAEWLKIHQGITINPESRFDVLVKRIHEYKRQLLNVLRIIYLYNELKNNPKADILPQTFIFAGKAASNYIMAKRIIKLINQVAAEIEKDKVISKIIKVVFVENYSVTIAEKLMPATEVSQQISLAGQEASGTGNMKAVMNGALMMCTYDGANAEIAHLRCNDGTFTFGLSPFEVERTWRDGYNPIDIYNSNKDIVGVIDALNNGFNGESFKDIASYLLNTCTNKDNYMCLADFEEFIEAHKKMDALYRKPLEWGKVVMRNISKMGYFSADRAILDYVKNVWHLTKLK